MCLNCTARVNNSKIDYYYYYRTPPVYLYFFLRTAVRTIEEMFWIKIVLPKYVGNQVQSQWEREWFDLYVRKYQRKIIED